MEANADTGGRWGAAMITDRIQRFDGENFFRPAPARRAVKAGIRLHGQRVPEIGTDVVEFRLAASFMCRLTTRLPSPILRAQTTA